MSKIAEVAVGLPIDKTFHYSIPPDMESAVTIGKRVWIPFGQKRIVGYVIGLGQDTEGRELKNIEQAIDDFPVLSAEMIELARWISRYYFCTLGEAIENTLPGGIRRGRTEIKERKAKEEEAYTQSRHLTLTQEQQDVFDLIMRDIKDSRHNVYVLHGVTASGKTELYLQAIDFALKRNKSSIALVPEISLTPQTTERFRSRFGEQVSVIHSRLSEGRRFNHWQDMKKGKSNIVVGARSAVFSPLNNLGLIILDEEHETSYKQEDKPRYHAREVAIKRAQLTNSVVILGSATPSIESYYKALEGEYKLVKLTKRVEERILPPVKIVDMKQEIMQRRRVAVFSLILQDRIRKAIENKKQVMLFLNRRGFSTHLDCKKCGFVMKCKRCDSVLVYHSESKRLICHYCSKKYGTPRICPSCKGAYLKFFGMGTQKVESELHRLFPQARIARMDTDATTKRGSYEKILGEFKKGKIDILVGTQMIAKGLHFQEVSLVGVVMAD
ncbi:MAG: primosomal protein N', partial [Candidatus Omnitrophota bacterium]